MTAVAERPRIALQVNAVTKDPYTRSNQMLLQIAHAEGGYLSDEWLTFRQALEIGRVVRKGQHGVRLGRRVEVADKATGDLKHAMKGFVVFNIEQTDALPPKEA